MPRASAQLRQYVAAGNHGEGVRATDTGKRNRLQGRIEGKAVRVVRAKAVLANKVLQTTCSVPRQLDER